MEKQLALIVDLDGTLCTDFDIPVAMGVEVLKQIDERKTKVHYVTARTGVCRDDTEVFLKEQGLPGAQNVHYCPDGVDGYEHKRVCHHSLAHEFLVIASIGDSDKEAIASQAAGIPFVAVDPRRPEPAWSILRERIAAAGGFLNNCAATGPG
jgi:phosphoglycolate phosphatase-like HAD superfamily hydrolase